MSLSIKSKRRRTKREDTRGAHSLSDTHAATMRGSRRRLLFNRLKQKSTPSAQRPTRVPFRRSPRSTARLGHDFCRTYACYSTHSLRLTLWALAWARRPLKDPFKVPPLLAGTFDSHKVHRGSPEVNLYV